MRAVWKFPLTERRTTIKMPVNAVIRHVDMQDTVTLWAEVETKNPIEERHFVARGTGEEILAAGRHVGTALTRDAAHVWHVYEEVYK